MADVEALNHRIMRMAKPGDVVEFSLNDDYSHWAVYVGNGDIIHITGAVEVELASSRTDASSSGLGGNMFEKAFVLQESFMKVGLKYSPVINNTKDRLCRPNSSDDIVEAAKGMLGEQTYNLLWHNSEHFAVLCRYGTIWAEQIERVEKTVIEANLFKMMTKISDRAYETINKLQRGGLNKSIYRKEQTVEI